MTALSSRNLFFRLLLLSLLGSSNPSWATVLVYFWHDDSNLIHFSSQRPHNRDNVYAVEMPSFSDEQAAKLEQNPLSYEALFAAAGVEQAAAAVNEMTSAVEEVARNAVSTSEASGQSNQAAREGRDRVMETARAKLLHA